MLPLNCTDWLMKLRHAELLAEADRIHRAERALIERPLPSVLPPATRVPSSA